MDEKRHRILLRSMGFYTEPLDITQIITAIKSRRPGLDIIVQNINRIIDNRYVAFYIRTAPRLETMSYCGETEEEAMLNLLDAFQDF